MHNDTPGAIITYRGHSITADEAHAALYGTAGLFVGSVTEIEKPLRNEPHYFLGAFVACYLLGRLIPERQLN